MSLRTYGVFAVIILVCLTIPFAYALWQRSHGTPDLNVRVVVHNSPPPSDTPTPTPDRRFHILLVPGHDTDAGGANYLDIYERNVAVDLAQDIASRFASDGTVSVAIARDTKSWRPELADFFATQRDAILAFKTSHQEAQRALIASGAVKTVPDMAFHTTVDQKTAVELYGLNMWANNHDIDLLVHIHFNNDGRANQSLPGTYSGFSVYVPESQMPNAAPSRAAAQYVFDALKTMRPADLPKVTGDQSLIALGASSTLTKPSMLIEYGYIYEKPLRDATTRAAFLNTLADATAAGLRAYLTTHTETTP